MKVKNHVFIFLFILSALHTPIEAIKKHGLLGKRYVSVGYGSMSKHESNDAASIGSIGMSIPLTRKLDLGFGTHQSWSSSAINDVVYDHRNHSFYSTLRYHFLPGNVINPFIQIEMGHVSSTLSYKKDSPDDDQTTNSSTLIFGNPQDLVPNLSKVDFYYSAAIGEEFLFSNDLIFSAYFNIGNINMFEYQLMSASAGFWLFKNLMLETQLRYHFNTNISEFKINSSLRI